MTHGVNLEYPIDVQYGGISFGCPYGCGNTEYDFRARNIAQILEQAVRRVFSEYDCKLPDKQGYWQPFCSAFIDLDNMDCGLVGFCRYKWETMNGVYLDSDVWHERREECFEDYRLDMTHSSIAQVFNLLRSDLFYYHSQKVECHKERIRNRQQKLEEISQTLEAKCSGSIPYESDLSLECSYLQRRQKVEREAMNELLSSVPDERAFEASLMVLNEASCKADTLFREIFLRCLKNHQPEGLAFQGVLDSFLGGDLLEALDQLRKFIELAEKQKFSQELISKIHLLKGQLQLEFGLYGDAIVSLTEAIAKTPSLKEAYLERATAYFELGQYDRAIEDYLKQKETTRPQLSADQLEFAKGFSIGTTNGVGEALVEFIPHVLSSLQGLGHFLWSTIQHPIEAPRQLVVSALAVCAKLRECTPYELAVCAIPELGDLVKVWDEIDDFNRGKQIGFILGKHGTEVLTPLAIKKGTTFVAHLQDFKKADKLATLETLSNPATKAATIETAGKWAENRAHKLSKIKLEADKQGKHIRTERNFKKDSSEWTHPDPESKLQELAGTGQRLQGEFGFSGYRERVDCGEVIGYYVDGNTKERSLTSMAIIHYSKKGAHLVPARPKE